MYLSACLLTAPASPFSIGKKRLWVITAPSHNDHYLRMMEKQLEDTEQVRHLFSYSIEILCTDIEEFFQFILYRTIFT